MRILDVDNATAIQADEVVVLVELWVEPGSGAGVACLGHEAEGNEGIQNAVDGHPRNLGEQAVDGAVELLGSRMVGAVEDRFKDDPTLGSDRQATFAVGGEEKVHSLVFVGRTHDYE